jgi:hypothetical protein
MGRIDDALEARREFSPFVVAEVGMDRAGRDDEIIVRQRLRAAEQHAAAGGVDAGHFRQQHRRIVLAAQDVRIGQAMSAGESTAVATWYSSGWKQ